MWKDDAGVTWNRVYQCPTHWRTGTYHGYDFEKPNQYYDISDLDDERTKDGILLVHVPECRAKWRTPR